MTEICHSVLVPSQKEQNKVHVGQLLDSAFLRYEDLGWSGGGWFYPLRFA